MKGVRIYADISIHRDQVELSEDPIKELKSAGFEYIGDIPKDKHLQLACSTIVPDTEHFIVLPEMVFGTTYLCFGDVMVWSNTADVSIDDTLWRYKIFNAQLPDDVHVSDLCPRKLVYRCWKCDSTALELNIYGQPVRCAECGAPVDAKGKSMLEHVLEHIENINPFKCYIYPKSIEEKIMKGELR